ncbi:MAG: protein tlpB [Flavobacterium sp. MedPE-SWcel]|uniref:MauE/DoxX family redox-associated membrane protein n=1 Tax=uncultured Flavobacterium sp. TaxID=165435 RepID=UPI00091FDF0D|nr:MauE/DoxX family redox-associated membrane protein [uncultured Flavobacterium sp.]OIQ22433.1 MAG: protein tlpB [Flavobacterium sp. MedPE-SWcel]
MKKYLPVILRIVVAFLFLISAVAKMYPSPYFAITTFEVKQLYVMGFSESFAPYFSRTLIGLEIALGLLLLQPNYLKKLVIPSTILMLLVFTTHLTVETIQNGGNSGNCGCFGELLPMTPIEAIIKNVVAILLLVVLSKLTNPSTTRKNNFWVLTTVTLASILAVFMLAPIQPQTTAVATTNDGVTEVEFTNVTDGAPAPVQSIYAQYFPNIDKNKKIVALFAPGCEHCRDAAKELTALKNEDENFPEMSVLFMDEEADLIPEFFEYAGKKYPYQVLDIINFWKILGDEQDTPGIIYLWNGNVIEEWDGINDNKFVTSELVEALSKPYSTETNK